MKKVWVLIDQYGNVEAVCDTMNDFLAMMAIRADLSERYYAGNELELIRIPEDELEGALI